MSGPALADPDVIAAIAFLERTTRTKNDYPATPAQLHRIIRVLAAVEASKRFEAEAIAAVADEAAGLIARLQRGEAGSPAGV